MTKQQALREARRRWGRSASIQDNRRATSDELRAEASARLKALRELPTPPANTPEAKARRREISQLASESCRQRYSVGTIDTACGFGVFFVCGQGDTWEQAFAEVDRAAASRYSLIPKQTAKTA